MTGWASTGKTREEAEATMTALIDNQGIAYVNE